MSRSLYQGQRSNQGYTIMKHTFTPTNVPTKHLLSTPYGFQDIARTRFSKSRSLQQGQRSNQGHTMTLHTYNPLPMSLTSINSLHLIIFEIQLNNLFPLPTHLPTRKPAHPDTMGENNTPAAIKGYWVIMIGMNPIYNRLSKYFMHTIY